MRIEKYSFIPEEEDFKAYNEVRQKLDALLFYITLFSKTPDKNTELKIQTWVEQKHKYNPVRLFVRIQEKNKRYEYPLLKKRFEKEEHLELDSDRDIGRYNFILNYIAKKYRLEHKINIENINQNEENESDYLDSRYN